jgi:hypothetical protein
LIPMVVLMHVPRAVATRSVGENACPLPLLSVGASVESLDSDGPCVASQCKSPVYLIEMLTMTEYATHCALCHVEGSLSMTKSELRITKEARNPNDKTNMHACSPDLCFVIHA